MLEINSQNLFNRLSYPGNRIKNCGRFEVVLPKVFGFCGGVIHALKLLEETIVSNPGKNLFLLGEIIHNANVNEYFQKKGVKIIPQNAVEKVFSIAEVNDIIVIPAFGVRLDLESKIRQYFRIVVDTTCKDVKRVWDFVKAESMEGSTIIIHGYPNHPEVRATISRISCNSAILIVSHPQEIESFLSIVKHRKSFLDLPQTIDVKNSEKFNPNRIALANQTTMLFSKTIEIETILKKTLEQLGRTFIACPTICKATYNRQMAALQLLEKEDPDLVFVLGGYGSSNTNNLYSLANKMYPTFYIRDSFSIKEKLLEHYIPSKNITTLTPLAKLFSSVGKIAVLAGASCPIGIVNELIDRLKNC